jgi:V/A-type H+-transporting ATPase subunit C
MTSKYDFAYSVALIRTLENFLLNENEVERMMLAPSSADAFKILNEFDYSDNKAGIENQADFQKVIDEGLLEIVEILKKVTPEKRILYILWFHYDFHNIKTMVKALLSGKPYEEIEPLLNRLGAIPLEALKKFIFEKENVLFGLEGEQTEHYIKKKIRKVQELFEKEKNPQIIDLYLDQKLMKVIHGIAQDSQNQFLIEYIKKYIDLNNIRLMFRMKSQEKPAHLFKIALLWNGNIPATRFKDAFRSKLSELPDIMKLTAYAKIVETGYKHFENEKTFIYLEREIENYLTEFIKKAKLIPFGPEALIAYFLAKKNNALIIRMIMVNKLNNVDPEEIRTRLRTLYR